MNFIISATLGILNLLFFVLSLIFQSVLNKSELNTIHFISFVLMAIFLVVGTVAHMQIRKYSPESASTIKQMLMLAGGVPASSILLVIAGCHYLGYLHPVDAGVFSIIPAVVYAITAVCQAGFVCNDIVAVVQKWQAARSGAAVAIDVATITATTTAVAHEDVRSSAGILESVTHKFGSERDEQANVFARQIVALYIDQFESDKLTNESARIAFETPIDFSIIFRAEKILRARGWRLSIIDQQSFIFGPCVPSEIDGFAGVFSF